MKYRKLGDSDLEVSEISLGSWLTYGVGVEADAARACLEEAFEQGINFIDTANVYGRGAAETFLGEALQGKRRESYVLATKLYFPMSESDHGLSATQIEKQLDASLKRLRTNYVDLYQCHRYDWDTPLEETMEALTRAVESGKARAIGFSEWPAERIRAALDLTGVAKFVSSQPQYSLLWREPEDEVIPLCAQRLKPIAEDAGLTLPQFALAWALREPNVASAIIGASRSDQVRENAAASGVAVDTQLFLRAEAVLDETLSRSEPA